MTEFTRTESTYTDDVVAVMRDTITALREQVAHLEACNDQLRIGETELNRELTRLRARLEGSPLPEGM